MKDGQWIALTTLTCENKKYLRKRMLTNTEVKQVSIYDVFKFLHLFRIRAIILTIFTHKKHHKDKTVVIMVVKR